VASACRQVAACSSAKINVDLMTLARVRMTLTGFPESIARENQRFPGSVRVIGCCSG
jgi:hypothetical protein